MHSTTTVILFAILAFLVGFIVKFLMGRAGNTDYKSMFEAADKENQDATKNLARAQKSLESSHKERDAWKMKHDELSKKISQGQNSGKAEIKDLKDQILAAQNETSTVEAEKERANTRFDRLKNEFESYKRKMQVEKDAIKGYKNELVELRKSEAENAAANEKLSRQNNEMKASLEKQFQKMGEINELKSNNRRLRAKNIKIQTDLEYWEKKHFETHHTLAALQKKLEQA